MADRLDTDYYQPEDLIELRVPLQIPYLTGWETDERVDGEIDIDGVHYSYVTRRLVNDTLILQVIPNLEKTKIRHARETFYALVNDMQELDAGSRSPLFPKPPRKPFSYDAGGLPSMPMISGVADDRRLKLENGNYGLHIMVLPVVDPPPDPQV